MTDDQTPTSRFTDDESAFWRHVRFGELPARIRPEERVELTETEDPRDVPPHLGDPDVWRQMRVGGSGGG